MKAIINWDVIIDALKGKVKAKKSFLDILDNEDYNPLTTDYVILKVVDDLISLKKREEAIALLKMTLGPKPDQKVPEPILTHRLDVIRTSSQNVEEGRQWLLRHFEHLPLNLSDWITLSVIRENDIPFILTPNEAFDKLKSLKDPSLPTVERIGDN